MIPAADTDEQETDADLVSRWRQAALGCAGVVLALGIFVVAGRAFGLSDLRSIAPGGVTMKANAAVCFVLAGIALACAAARGSAARSGAARCVAASALLLLALLTLGQYLLGADFGLDLLLFSAPPEPQGGASAGRTAIAAAVGLAFSAVGLLLLDSRRWERASQLAALFGALIGAVAILGHAYGVSALEGVGSFSTVAFVTAIGLVVINVGVLAARPTRGLMAIVTSTSAGGVLARRLLPVAILAPFAIGWLRVEGERRGYYSAELGVALVALAYVVLFGALIWRTAGVLRESERRRSATERARRRQQAELAGIIETAMDAIVMVDAAQRIVLFNPAAERMFGHVEADMLGRPLEMLIPAGSRDTHRRHVLDFGGTDDTNRRMVGPGAVTGLRANGEEFPIEASVSQLDAGGEKYFTVILRDVTDRKRIEADLRVAATAFEAHVGIVVCDARGVILRVNRKFVGETGYAPEELVGQSPRILKSGRHDAGFYEAMWESIRRTGVWQGEIWDRRKNGEIYPKWLTITAVRGEGGAVTHYVGTQTDITDRKAAEEEIRYLAFFDPLTRLPNRRLLLDRLHQAAALGSRSGRFSALLFIDLDNFKALNDTLGHNVGDLLLQRVAQRLLGCVREADTVARLGGDEFVIMLENLSAVAGEAAAEARAVGEKILAALNEPHVLDGHECRSTPSIGVTLFGRDHESIERLLQQADLAMYQAKGAGRNAVCFFDPAMQAAVHAQVALESDLRNALRRGQFVLHFQPQVDDGGLVGGAEALVRWQHPERGLVLPNDFIPLCEETGLILQLGHWVLESACAQLATWSANGDTRHLTLAVNVSVQQLRQAHFVAEVLAVLERTGAEPGKLKLELTESQLMSNVEEIIEKMAALKAHGVSFALDDFGTGYSSLAYLKRLLLDRLKIDRSFVSDVLVDRNDAAIAQSIVALAKGLGLTVIAEGVESEAQRAFLAGIGCHAYQGYLCGRPVPIEEFEQLLTVLRQSPGGQTPTPS